MPVIIPRFIPKGSEILIVSTAGGSWALPQALIVMFLCHNKYLCGHDCNPDCVPPLGYKCFQVCWNSQSGTTWFLVFEEEGGMVVIWSDESPTIDDFLTPPSRKCPAEASSYSRVFKLAQHEEIALEAVFNQQKQYFEHGPKTKPSGIVMICEDHPTSVCTSPTIPPSTLLPMPSLPSTTPVTLTTGASPSNMPSPIFVFNLELVTMPAMAMDTISHASPVADIAMDEMAALLCMGPDVDELFNFDDEISAYAAPATPEELEVEELLVFYAGRDDEEEAYQITVEAHKLWVAEKLKVEKAVEKKACERAKKLQELKSRKEVEATAKRAEEERIAKEVEEKKREEVVAMEAEQKRLAEAKEEAAQTRCLLKEQMELAARQAAEAAEATAKAAEGDEDEETMENVVVEKEKACEELHRRRAEKGKARATRAAGPSNKRKRLMRSVVEEREDERTTGPPEERPAKKMKGKAVEQEEFHGSDKCGWCQADGARCFMSAMMRSCERCWIRKAKCL
ncbi:hypothetical protein IW261DRAFT_1569604 [Armillaria novae-zelandiae]|uniref:Uncharacterized protein n=1 Tax=Armillaria novae-zelandiae TaxID=153914 RepID=A0AA39NX73_9AGAR|nr:hypothetical protein IW261DRAFT_1569604 [Armillaria novae-zelandiae]